MKRYIKESQNPASVFKQAEDKINILTDYANNQLAYESTREKVEDLCIASDDYYGLLGIDLPKSMGEYITDNTPKSYKQIDDYLDEIGASDKYSIKFHIDNIANNYYTYGDFCDDICTNILLNKPIKCTVYADIMFDSVSNIGVDIVKKIDVYNIVDCLNDIISEINSRKNDNNLFYDIYGESWKDIIDSLLSEKSLKQYEEWEYSVLRDLGIDEEEDI